MDNIVHRKLATTVKATSRKESTVNSVVRFVAHNVPDKIVSAKLPERLDREIVVERPTGSHRP